MNLFFNFFKQNKSNLLYVLLGERVEVDLVCQALARLKRDGKK